MATHPDCLIHGGVLDKNGNPKGGRAAVIKENTLEGIQGIADYLGRSYSTVHKWIKYHSFPAMISPTGEWFTTKAAVHAWIIATGAEDVRRMNVNPFDIPASVAQRFRDGSASIHERVEREKQSALEFLYSGRITRSSTRKRPSIRNRLYSEVA